MTKEALKLALEALEPFTTPNWAGAGVDQANEAATAIKEALAQEQDGTYVYASSLVTAIWQKHYIKESPKFALLDTTEGVLTQIDNMICGLVREKPAQPEQPEPVAYLCENEVGHKYFRWKKPSGTYKPIALYTTPPQRKPLTEEQILEMWGLHDVDPGIVDFVRAIEAAHGIKENT